MINLNTKNLKVWQRVLAVFFCALFLMSAVPMPAYAAVTESGVTIDTGNDQLDHSLARTLKLISNITITIGILIGIYAIIQIGISFAQRDESARATGLMFLVGAVIIAVGPSLFIYLVYGSLG